MNPKDEISPDEDLINPWRLAQGDLEVAKNLKGKVSRAIPANLTIAKELIRRGVFPYHFEVYGHGFLELQNAFRAPWAAKCSAVLLEQWGAGVSNSLANEIYQTVYRKTGGKRIEVIRFAIEENKNRESEMGLLVYKECFERLIEAMDEERERVSSEQKKY